MGDNDDDGPSESELRARQKAFLDTLNKHSKACETLAKNVATLDGHVTELNGLVGQLFEMVPAILEKFAGGGDEPAGPNPGPGGDYGSEIDWAGAGIDALAAVLKNRRKKR